MNTPQNPRPQNNPAAASNGNGGYGPAPHGGYGAPSYQQGSPAGNPTAWPKQPQPKKKSGKGLKILLGIIVVIVLLLLLAEFGLRAYAKGQIADSVKEQAAQSHTDLASDPEVSFGKSSMLLGALSGDIKNVDITLPSSLKVTTADSGNGTPEVSGNPEVHIQAKHIKGRSESDMHAGELSMQTEVPTELMLAQAQKSQSEGQSGANNSLAKMFTLTGIETDPDNGVLNFAIGGGLAKLAMHPKAEDGKLKMDVESGQLLGFDMPQSLIDSVRDSLTKESQGGIIEGMDVTDVKVTEHGMELHMHGKDVDLAKIGAQGANTQQQGGPGTGGGNGQSKNPVNPARPYGSSGDGYGSSKAA